MSAPGYASCADGRQAADRSLLGMMDEAQHHLQHLEISCRHILSPTGSASPQKVEPSLSDPKVLQLQVAHLRAQLLATVTCREDEDVAFRQAAQYATAKGSANGVLHALFDQASAGKTAVLKTYLDTGSIPTRDGLRHWKLDLRTIRNEAGATLLHVAVGVSTARQNVKVKLVLLLVDRVGFDPNVRDVFGQTPLHVAAMGGYQEVVQALLERGADPVAQDRSGLTPLSLVRTLSRPPEEVVQTLVDAESAAMRMVRLETVFASTIYWDPDFVSDLKLEADGYGMSLISPALAAGALTGPTWAGVLSKLIQGLKLEMAEPAQTDAQANDTTTPTDEDVIMKDTTTDNALVASSSRKWSMSSSSTSLSVDCRSALYYADQTTYVAKTRDVWYYAVLFKPSTHAFPGTITVTPESNVAISSEDVAKYFPLEDRLAIGSAEYFAIDYNSQTREIQLDRNYDGKEPATLKTYLTGACSSGLPPYVAVKRIWEREPGNKYEDQMSSEQELFQDYQFLGPESEYEVAIKLGPIPSGQEAREIVAEWKRTAKKLFDSRE
ncbi:hypothetical protein JG688_00003134 [Phytophthora aleatoria]|uniref:Uncharacterized protein n=1 Tax=Phytophthora aleatoria TaxID=2496075 RepID=A0A8J5M881_9STRA|nr:hypothetical protein JG688_00003134 [Phytophthora aleatoria]